MSDHRGRSQRWQRGAIVRIPLPDGHHAYAQMLEQPEYAFFDHFTKLDVAPAVVATSPTLFRLWVMRYAHSNGRWTKIGKAPIAEPLMDRIQRFNQDPITGRIILTFDGCKGVDPTIEECENLECAAVWDPEHVEDRLNDCRLGVPSRWARSLRPKQPPNKRMQPTADGRG